jgi:V/A-type H+-transporting ATPase subunit E
MSEKSLDQLIAKVKSEAIDKAEQEAKDIIDKAKKAAAQITADARVEEEEIRRAAEKEADELVKKGKIALQQAARDVQITVKNNLLNVFKAVLKNKVKTAFSPDVYTEAVRVVISNMGNHLEINLPGDLEDELVEAIRDEAAQNDTTVKILKDDQLVSGLSIHKTEEGWTYDISGEEVSDLLGQHLSQKWLEILNKA